MEEQNQQPRVTGQQPNLQPSITPNQPGGEGKPKPNLSAAEAQNLLSINNLLAEQQPKSKSPTKFKLLIICAVLIILAVIASFILGSLKPGNSKNSGSNGGIGLPKQSNPTNSSGVTNQVNQDVKACSNPVNAALVC